MDNNFNDIIGSANNAHDMSMSMPDLREYPLVKCDDCGGVAFTPAMAIRRVPGIVLGMGDKNQLIPEQILVCATCGTVYKKDRVYLGLEKDDEKEEETKKSETKTSSLII